MIHEEIDARQLLFIGEKLAATRRLLGQNIKNVGGAVGLTLGVISRIENGRYPGLKVTTLIALCKHLHISAEELLVG